MIGGGIAGSSVAYHVARAGLQVTLLERGMLAGGVTSKAVGLLSPPLRQPYHQLVFDLGREAAAQVWEFGLRSVEGLGDLLIARGEAEYAQLDAAGGFMLAERHTEDVVRGAYEAMRAARLPVEWLSAADVKERTGGRGFSGGYRLAGGGAVDAAKASRALAQAAAGTGARTVEDAEVVSVEACQGGFLVQTRRGEIRCAAVVYTTNLAGGFLGALASSLVPVTAQAFQTAPLPARFQGGFATEWKSNVWRQRRDGRLVVSGWRQSGFERAFGVYAPVDPAVQDQLRAWFEWSFPDLGPLEIEHEWSGTWGWTPDLLPIVGGVPRRSGEWVAAGFEGGGLAFAFESGRTIAHAIVGDEPVLGSALLDPARLVRDEGVPA